MEGSAAGQGQGGASRRPLLLPVPCPEPSLGVGGAGWQGIAPGHIRESADSSPFRDNNPCKTRYGPHARQDWEPTSHCLQQMGGLALPCQNTPQAWGLGPGYSGDHITQEGKALSPSHGTPPKIPRDAPSVPAPTPAFTGSTQHVCLPLRCPHPPQGQGTNPTCKALRPDGSAQCWSSEGLSR